MSAEVDAVSAGGGYGLSDRSGADAVPDAGDVLSAAGDAVSAAVDVVSGVTDAMSSMGHSVSAGEPDTLSDQLHEVPCMPRNALGPRRRQGR